MKKLKLLTSIAGFVTLSSVIAPALTSCGCTNSASDVIPTDLLEIDGNTLKGFKEDADISKYTTLEVPSNVKIIDKLAFGQEDVDYSHIYKLVVPANVEEIRDYAFAGLTSLLEADFTALGSEQAHYLVVGQNIFGLGQMSNYCSIKLSDGLTEVAKEYLIKKLINAGIPESWFVAPTTGHFDLVGEKEVEHDGVIPAEYTAKLTSKPSNETNYDVILQKTGGTDGIDVYKETSSSSNSKSDTEVNFSASMYVETGHKLTNGDHVIYRAVILANTISGTSWVQTIDGLKLTYNGDGNIAMTGIEFDYESVNLRLGDEIQFTPTIYPRNCTDKTLVWKSSDESVATVDKDGLVTTNLTEGTTIITASSSDGKVKAEIKVNTIIDISMFEIYYYYAEWGIIVPVLTSGESSYSYRANSQYLIQDNGQSGYVVGLRWEDSKELEDFTNLYIPNSIVLADNEPYPVVATGMGSWVDPEPFTNKPYQKVEKVKIGDNVRVIGAESFAYLNKLKEVEFGENTTCWQIQHWAFDDTAIEEIDLPKSVVSMDATVFEETPLYTNSSNWTTDNNIQYLKLGTGENANAYALASSFTRGYEPSTENLDIKFNDKCELISSQFVFGDQGWDKDHPISSIDFGSNVRGIGERAFATKQLLIKGTLQMPSTLKYIGSKAFFNGYDIYNRYMGWEAYDEFYINNLVLNEGLEWINEGAFATGLLYDKAKNQSFIKNTITIPSTVKELGLRRFNYFDGSGGTLILTAEYYAWNYNPYSVYENPEGYTGVFTNMVLVNGLKWASGSKLKMLGYDTFNNTYIYNMDYDSFFNLPSSLETLCPGSLAILSTIDSNVIENPSNSFYNWIENNKTTANPFTITIPASVVEMQYPFYNTGYFLMTYDRFYNYSLEAGFDETCLYTVTFDENQTTPLEFALRLNFEDKVSSWWCGQVMEPFAALGEAPYYFPCPVPNPNRYDSWQEYNMDIYQNYLWYLAYSGYEKTYVHFKVAK